MEADGEAKTTPQWLKDLIASNYFVVGDELTDGFAVETLAKGGIEMYLIERKMDIKKPQIVTKHQAWDKILRGKIIRVEVHPIPEHPCPHWLSSKVARVGDVARYVIKCLGEGVYFVAKRKRMCSVAIAEESEMGKRMVEGGDLRKYLGQWDKSY